MFKAKCKYSISVSIIAASIALTGCGLNPYVSAKVPRPGLSTGDVQAILNGQAFQPGSSNIITKPVSIEAAAQYGRFLQDAYGDALAVRARQRRGSNLATIWTGITTLGLEAVDTGGDTTLITGLTASALGISNQSLLTRNHEAAYSLGARQVGCVLTAATNNRPTAFDHALIDIEVNRLSSSIVEYASLVQSATVNSNFKIANFEADLLSELRKIDAQIQSLEVPEERVAPATSESSETVPEETEIARPRVVRTYSQVVIDKRALTQAEQDQINRLNLERKRIESEIDEVDEKKRQLAAALSNKSQNSRSWLSSAQRAIAVGEAVLADHNRLGDQLLNKIEEIRWEVNDAVRRTDPDLIQLDSNLRSVVGNQLNFANIGLTNVPQIQQPDEVAESGSAILEIYWSKSDSIALEIEESIQSLNVALDELKSKPVLSFPANTFQSCSLSGIQALTGVADLTLSPTNIELRQGFLGGDALASISGGTPPYGVSQTEEDNVTIEGNIVRVTLTNSQGAAGAQPLQYVVSDLYGKSAILTITPPTAPQTRTVTTTVIENDPVKRETDEPHFVTNATVGSIQNFLTNYNGGSWLNDLADRDAIPGLSNELKGGNGFIDRGFGVVTRRVLQRFITEESASLYQDVLKGADNEQNSEECVNALTALRASGANMDEAKESGFYTEQQVSVLEISAIDEPLINFALSCEFIKR